MDIRGIDRQLGKILGLIILQVNTFNEGKTADALIDQSKQKTPTVRVPGGRVAPGNFTPRPSQIRA